MKMHQKITSNDINSHFSYDNYYYMSVSVTVSVHSAVTHFSMIRLSKSASSSVRWMCECESKNLMKSTLGDDLSHFVRTNRQQRISTHNTPHTYDSVTTANVMKKIESKQFVYTLIKEQSLASHRNVSYMKRCEKKERAEESTDG